MRCADDHTPGGVGRYETEWDPNVYSKKSGGGK